MKSNFILNSILAIAAFFSLNIVCSDVLIREEINVFGNKEGIKSDEKCFMIYSSMNPANLTIVCEEAGKETHTFKNVGKVVGSATGTPPWLEFGNYIGSRLMDKGESHKMGEGKREIFCYGPCEKKESGEVHAQPIYVGLPTHEGGKMHAQPIYVGSPHK